ncbi:MAG TPA: prolipoprotein diacylglyceryl transferase family protein [Anaerolineales bacterium]
MQLFSLLLGLGALAGLVLAGWRAPQKERLRYLDAGVLTLLGALIGSRALAVAVSFSYYQSHLSEIVQVWLGGLSSIGALIGGLLAVFVIAVWWRIPLGLLADVLIPLAGTLTVTSWMGCWVDRCGYGMLSNSWWALPARDEWGVLADRVPVQLIGAIATLVLLWLLDRAARRMPVQGMSATLGLYGISVIIFLLSYIRADPTPIWNGLRLEAWGALGMMIFSSFTLVVLLSNWQYKKYRIPQG